MTTTFKFLRVPKDYTISVDHVPMYKVLTYKNITQDMIDEMNDAVHNFLYERDTEENRRDLMEELSKYFHKIEPIENEKV